MLGKYLERCSNCSSVIINPDNMVILEVHAENASGVYKYCSKKCSEVRLKNLNAWKPDYYPMVHVDKIDILSEKPLRMRVLLKMEDFKVSLWENQ